MNRYEIAAASTKALEEQADLMKNILGRTLPATNKRQALSMYSDDDEPAPSKGKGKAAKATVSQFNYICSRHQLTFV